MSPLANRPFKKMNGLGNKIIVLDLRGTQIAVAPGEARSINGAEGLSFDQLMVIHDPRRPDTLAYVSILNSDGSRAEACGNGTRCVAWALSGHAASQTMRLETDAGVVSCEADGDGGFTVDMGPAKFGWSDIPLRTPCADTGAVVLDNIPSGLNPASVVNVGNPHAVFWVDDLDSFDLQRIGPGLETHPMFPAKANITLARLISRSHVRIKVWERGAGETRACGTAACATAAAAYRKGVTENELRVSLPGGDLGIRIRSQDAHILMSGPVEFEFEGRFSPKLFTATA